MSLLLVNAQVSFASTLYSNTFNNTSLSDWTLETGNNVVCDTSSGSLEADGSHSCLMDLNTSFDTLKCVSMDIDTTNTTRDDYFLQTQGNFNNHGGNWTLDFQPDDGSRNIVLANGLDAETATASINTPTGVHNYTVCQNSGTYTAYLDNSQIITYTPTVSLGNMVSLRLGQNLSDLAINPMNNVVLSDTLPSSPTPTPTPTQVQILTSPASATETVGQPFNVTVAVNGGGTTFNAAQATVAVSSNLSIIGTHSAPSPACNFQYTQTPTAADPSFAGAIYGSSSTNCNVYTLTLTPNAAGTGTITVTNGSIKSYADNSEILTSVTNGSYTINAANATPTPTPALSGLTITSPTETYHNTYTFTGTKDANTTTIFVNGSSTGVTYPTSTTWQATETLTLGANNTAGSNAFTVYGNGNQTATISTTVSLHELGDINGDGAVDLTDASLFAVDWGKTSNLTYLLSDMNGDGSVDLTDLSILAKLISQ